MKVRDGTTTSSPSPTPDSTNPRWRAAVPLERATAKPLGTWEGGREKAPAALSRKIAVAKLTGVTEVKIWGDGKQTRSFCYIDDCIEARTG